MMRAKVLYDFTAQQESSEINLYKDEILTILDKNIGEGWWEGKNDRGEQGLFPACYVEELQDVQPAPPTPQQPPMPQQQQYQNIPASNQPVVANNNNNSNSSFFAPVQMAQFKPPEPTSVHEEPDWPDEDWDDEDDSGDNATEYGGPTGTSGSQRGSYPIGAPYYGSVAGQQSVAGGVAQQQQQQQLADLSSATTNLAITDHRNNQLPPGPIKAKKNFNRFSNFVKSGLESYLLEGKGISVSLENIVHIQYDQELGIIWKPNLNPYTCAVTKHGKESKMKGLKTYISYDVTPSTSNVVVRRRYKHFDWLMQRLEEKFLVTPLPPLPEKQIAGRFQEDFVEHRRNLLQLWVNYITRHPVLSQCDVWWHFITCKTDDMKGWKLGKRKAEKDELVGANFFFSVEVDPNTVPLDSVKTTKQLDNFQRFVSKLDESVKHMFTTTIEQSKKFSTIYAKDYKKLGESIKELSSAFQSGTAWRNSLGLNEAIRQTSSAYEDISKLHEEEPKYDFEPMADILHQYRGLLSGWPEILQLHKNTMNTRAEQERLLEEGKISESDMARINVRANVATYSTLAEINHFHNERLVDFKQMMQSFLIAQINFHSEILGKLQTALHKINDA